MDGKEVNPPVQLDISFVIDLFDGIPTVHWQSDPVASDDELAQHISFLGDIGVAQDSARCARGNRPRSPGPRRQRQD